MKYRFEKGVSNLNIKMEILDRAPKILAAIIPYIRMKVMFNFSDYLKGSLKQTMDIQDSIGWKHFMERIFFAINHQTSGRILPTNLLVTSQHKMVRIPKKLSLDYSPKRLEYI